MAQSKPGRLIAYALGGVLACAGEATAQPAFQLQAAASPNAFGLCDVGLALRNSSGTTIERLVITGTFLHGMVSTLVRFDFDFVDPHSAQMQIAPLPHACRPGGRLVVRRVDDCFLQPAARPGDCVVGSGRFLNLPTNMLIPVEVRSE